MVYLLHFKTPFKHAKHYVGYVKSPDGLEERMRKHVKGSGAKLMRAVTNAGIDFEIARTWVDGDQNFERWLKNLKATPRICPACNPNAMKRAIGPQLEKKGDLYA